MQHNVRPSGVTLADKSVHEITGVIGRTHKKVKKAESRQSVFITALQAQACLSRNYRAANFCSTREYIRYLSYVGVLVNVSGTHPAILGGVL